MKYTIEDLRNGKCAVINDGTLDELREVLRLAFPEDYVDLGAWIEDHYEEKFFVRLQLYQEWGSTTETELPTQSVKYFIENFKKDIKDSILKSRKSLDDKIKELKELAKSQEMDCDVVLSEKKRIEVSFLTSFGIRDDYKFVFKTNTSDNLHHAGEFLAKQLENYLNQE